MLNSKKRFCLLSFLNLTLNYFTGTIKLQFRTITIIVDRDKPWIQIWDEILVTAQGRIPFPLFWIWLGLGLWTWTWPQDWQFWPCCSCELWARRNLKALSSDQSILNILLSSLSRSWTSNKYWGMNFLPGRDTRLVIWKSSWLSVYKSLCESLLLKLFSSKIIKLLNFEQGSGRLQDYIESFSFLVLLGPKDEIDYY